MKHIKSFKSHQKLNESMNNAWQDVVMDAANVFTQKHPDGLARVIALQDPSEDPKLYNDAASVIVEPYILSTMTISQEEMDRFGEEYIDTGNFSAIRVVLNDIDPRWSQVVDLLEEHGY